MLMFHSSRWLIAAVALVLAACVSMPSGPSMMVLPGSGLSFEQFRFDDAECRQFASFQSGATAETAATGAAVESAVVGTAIGALAGAAINGRRGAGVGAGTGLLIGAMSGSGAAQVSGREAQRRYDNGYAQCMYAKGHRVPVSGHFVAPERQRQPAYYPPQDSPPPQYLAPPPPPATR
jgi:hypothetical protein